MSRNLPDLDAADAFYHGVKAGDFNLFEHIPLAIEALRTVNPVNAAELERHFVVFLCAQRADADASAAADAAAAAKAAAYAARDTAAAAKGAAYATLRAATTAAAAADAAYTARTARLHPDDLAAEAEARRTFTLFFDAFTLPDPAGDRP